MAPSSESVSIYNSYLNKGRLNDAFSFKIPVYNSMTKNAYKVSRTDTVGGNETDNGDNTENKSDDNKGETVVSVQEKIAKSGYKITSGYLTNIALGTDMSTLRDKLTNAGAVVASLNSAWNSKTSGAIATGDIIEIDSKERYSTVIYGDIDGDSNISVVDLLYIKKNILGDISLSGANKKAADINKDGRVDVVDLLLLKKYLLQEYSITQ